MASFIIEGGHRLNGDLIPQGAKNEALEVLCATLLTPEVRLKMACKLEVDDNE